MKKMIDIEDIEKMDTNKLVDAEKKNKIELAKGATEILKELAKDATGMILDECISKIPVLGSVNNLKSKYEDNKFKRDTENLLNDHSEKINNNSERLDMIERLMNKNNSNLENNLLNKLESAYKKYKEAKYKEAKEILIPVISVQPNNAMAHIIKGLCNRELMKYEDAIYDFSKAIDSQNELKEAYYLRMELYFKIGKFDEAYNDSNKLIMIDEEFECIYYNRAMINTYKNNINEAISDYTKSIEQGKNIISSLNGRSGLFLMQGEYDDALNDLNLLIELDKDKLSSYYHRAIIYIEKGLEEEALVELTNLINKNFKYAYFERAKLYFNKGKYEEALIDCNTFIDLAPLNYIGYDLRIHIYTQLNDESSAREDIKKIQQIKNQKESPSNNFTFEIEQSKTDDKDIYEYTPDEIDKIANIISFINGTGLYELDYMFIKYIVENNIYKYRNLRSKESEVEVKQFEDWLLSKKIYIPYKEVQSTYRCMIMLLRNSSLEKKIDKSNCEFQILTDYEIAAIKYLYIDKKDFIESIYNRLLKI